MLSRQVLTLSRSPVAASRLPAAAALLRAPRRAFGVFDDKEKAEEAVYFKKEEKELLKRLSKKLGLPAQAQVDTEAKDLKAIFQKHNASASDQCVKEIIEYFHTHK